MKSATRHRTKKFHIHSIRDRIYSQRRCFYCGKLLRHDATREHVFPRWLQERFELPHQRLTLLNGTQIPYRQLTIPCCSTCNNVHLSQLESRVQQVLLRGSLSEARRNLPSVHVWITKIMLGIIYAERSLPLNRRHPRGRRIYPREIADRFDISHFLVQSLRIPMRFSAEGESRLPGSVFLFDLKAPKKTAHQFDFKDDLLTHSISMRVGSRGIIAVNDGGAVDLEVGHLFRRESRRKLHPLQFAELTAKAFYKARLFNRIPKYLLAETNGVVRVEQLPLMGLSSQPVFDGWDPKVYVQFLSLFTGRRVEDLMPFDDGRVMTFIRNAKGRAFNIPLVED